MTLCCYRDVAIGGYGNGHVKLVNYHTGALLVEMCAHAQWISALHLAPHANLVSHITCSVVLVPGY